MRLINPHFLRILVALLITVFITNTVYAGGMMVSATISSMNEHIALQSQAEHAILHQAHEAHHDQTAHEHAAQQHGAENSFIIHHSQHQSPSHGSCSHCNHCLACYSIIVFDKVDMIPFTSQPVLAVAGKSLYLSPAVIQPNKPPIA